MHCPNCSIVRKAKSYLLITLVAMATTIGPGASANARDLSQILNQVEINTPALLQAEATTNQQRAALRQTKSKYWGEVDALVKSSHYNDERLINPIGYPVNMQAKLFDDNQFGYGINGHLPVDINGQITAQVKAADKKLAATISNAGNVRLQVLHSTADLYHSLAGVLAVETALKQQIAALTAHIKVITVAIDAGRTAPVERLRLVAAREQVKGKLATIQGDEMGIRARLAALLGQDAFADEVAALQSPPPATIAAMVNTADGNYMHEIDKRPDIKALMLNTEVADADKQAAFAHRLPTLNLNGSWLENRGYSEDGDHSWALLAQLKLPLWDGGGRRAAVAKAEARKTAMRQSLAQLQNRARAEIVAAKAAWDSASSSYSASNASLQAASASEQIQSDRFDAGRLSATDLLEAEATLAQASSNRALALTRWWQAEDHLRHAVGMAPAAYKKQPVDVQ